MVCRAENIYSLALFGTRLPTSDWSIGGWRAGTGAGSHFNSPAQRFAHLCLIKGRSVQAGESEESIQGKQFNYLRAGAVFKDFKSLHLHIQS